MKQFTAGDAVQTPLGKGRVTEVRNNGRLVVEIQGRTVVLESSVLTPIDTDRAKRGSKSASPSLPEATSAASAYRGHAAAEVDLHGLTVEEALARARQALNDAMLADLPELRFIHGRSGGRIKAALHRQLRQISAVRSIRLDPRNEGVTIVTL